MSKFGLEEVSDAVDNLVNLWEARGAVASVAWISEAPSRN